MATTVTGFAPQVLLTPPQLQRIAAAVGASHAEAGERVQSLWAGYGEIRRVRTPDGRVPSVIVKCIRPPQTPQHRRGWDGDISRQRKLRSYRVEAAFYANFAGRCGSASRVPQLLWAEPDSGVLVLEDLDAAGFAGRRGDCSLDEARACLSWLAHFHATFIGAATDGLWPVGTYWHLQTRPEELAAMTDRPLREAAGALDARLSHCRHRTLVHGDAKLANFCFGRAGVAGVDFQYVGGGCGMKDVVYFFSSALDADACEQHADRLLAHYFAALGDALHARPADHPIDAAALEAEWRALYPLAWADFMRFLDGWAPDHPKLHRYSRAMTEAALAAL